jgi:hypothetical protein
MQRFSQEEWRDVRLLPFVAFGMVASADGEIQREEAARFVEEIKSSAFCREGLRRALAQDILASDFMTLFRHSTDAARWDERLQAGKRALRRRLTDAEYRAFASGLVVFAVSVALAAKAAGDVRKSPEEESALIDLARRLDLDVEDLREELENPPC